MNKYLLALPLIAIMALLSTSCNSKSDDEQEGQNIMRRMMDVYTGDQPRYAALAGHGFRILAQAMEADLPYRIDCPALLLCGRKDQAGSTRRYNKAWHRRTGLPLVWLENAGHNANCDKPQMVNALLERFAARL